MVTEITFNRMNLKEKFEDNIFDVKNMFMMAERPYSIVKNICLSCVDEVWVTAEDIDGNVYRVYSYNLDEIIDKLIVGIIKNIKIDERISIIK